MAELGALEVLPLLSVTYIRKEQFFLRFTLYASNEPETILILNSVKPIAGKHRLLHFEVDEIAADYETEYKRLKNNYKHSAFPATCNISDS